MGSVAGEQHVARANLCCCHVLPLQLSSFTFAQFDVMKVSNIDVHTITFQTTRFLCQARPGTKNVQRLR